MAYIVMAYIVMGPYRYKGQFGYCNDINAIEEVTRFPDSDVKVQDWLDCVGARRRVDAARAIAIWAIAM